MKKLLFAFVLLASVAANASAIKFYEVFSIVNHKESANSRCLSFLFKDKAQSIETVIVQPKNNEMILMFPTNSFGISNQSARGMSCGEKYCDLFLSPTKRGEYFIAFTENATSGWVFHRIYLNPEGDNYRFEHQKRTGDSQGWTTSECLFSSLKRK